MYEALVALSKLCAPMTPFMTEEIYQKLTGEESVHLAEFPHENTDLINETVEERMDLDQFTECDITFRELDIIRNTITNTLAGVYHERVKYPKLKKGNNNGK